MNDHESGSFKIDLDEDEPELSPMHEGDGDAKLEKLSHRITIISIILPCLIGVILYITYADIKNRVNKNENTGVMEVQNLQAELEKRISEVTSKHTEFTKTLNDKLLSMDKSIASLSKEIKNTNSALNKINASKADKKEQASAIANLDKTLNPIKKKINKLAKGMDALDSNTSKKIAGLSESLDKSGNDVIKLKSELSTISTEKIDKDVLDWKKVMMIR